MREGDTRRRQGMDYGETADIQNVHAAVQREKLEPRAGLEPLSLWLIGVYGLAIFFGGAYLGRFSGSFSGDGLDPMGGAPHAMKQGPGGSVAAATELTPAERGKKIFSANCATCHQANGQGVAGQYPPLVGSEYVINGSRRPGMILLKGLQGPLKVKGAQYGSAVMQPWDKTLNDQKIADVITYIRSEWGNTAPPISAEGIAALRKEVGGHSESWSEADLLAVPAEANLAGGDQPPAGAPPAPAPQPKS